MTDIRIVSDHAPIWGTLLAATLAALLTRSAAMGVLDGPPVTRLDGPTVKRLLEALQQHGIASEAGVMLAPLMGEATRLDPPTEHQVMVGLKRLHEALEASAAPAVEWPVMRTLFGDEALATLVGVAPVSLRRYASAERATPDDVAARLHWLAMTVADLAGAYNDFGIRRWFERPRSALGGLSPRQRLGSGWSPDDASAQSVRALASVLSGPQALAV